MNNILEENVYQQRSLKKLSISRLELKYIKYCTNTECDPVKYCMNQSVDLLFLFLCVHFYVSGTLKMFDSNLWPPLLSGSCREKNRFICSSQCNV